MAKNKTAVNRLMMRPGQVSEAYGIPEGTLANWRCRRVGPKYFKLNRTIVYDVTDLENFFRKTPFLTTGI